MKHYTKLPKTRDGITTAHLVRVLKTLAKFDSPCPALTKKEQNCLQYLDRYAKSHNYHLDIRKPNIMLDGNTLVFTDPFISYKRVNNE